MKVLIRLLRTLFRKKGGFYADGNQIVQFGVSTLDGIEKTGLCDIETIGDKRVYHMKSGILVTGDLTFGADDIVFDLPKETEGE